MNTTFFTTEAVINVASGRSNYFVNITVLLINIIKEKPDS